MPEYYLKGVVEEKWPFISSRNPDKEKAAMLCLHLRKKPIYDFDVYEVDDEGNERKLPDAELESIVKEAEERKKESKTKRVPTYRDIIPFDFECTLFKH